MYSLHTNSKYWNGFVDIKQTNTSMGFSNIMLKESKAHENTFHFPFWFWKVASILSVGLELTYIGYFAWFDVKGEVEWNNQGNHLHVIWVQIMYNLDIFQNFRGNCTKYDYMDFWRMLKIWTKVFAKEKATISWRSSIL